MVVGCGGLALNHDLSGSSSTPDNFGPFRVLHQTGIGVLGPVFRAHDRDRLVAVKAFKLDVVPEQAADIAEELRALVARAPHHPRLVGLVGAGLEGDTPWLAMRCMVAPTLDTRLRDGRGFDLHDILAIVHGMAEAVDAAHAAGLLHGSLHPRDVFVGDGGAVCVGGFGVAAALEVAGLRPPVRLPYTAPETATDQTVEAPADRFSLGAIAFELLTGHRLLAPGDDLAARLEQWGGGGDVELAATAFSAMVAERADHRPSTAAAFAKALRLALAPGERPEPPTLVPADSAPSQAALEEFARQGTLWSPPSLARTFDEAETQRLSGPITTAPRTRGGETEPTSRTLAAAAGRAADDTLFIRRPGPPAESPARGLLLPDQPDDELPDDGLGLVTPEPPGEEGDDVLASLPEESAPPAREERRTGHRRADDVAGVPPVAGPMYLEAPLTDAPPPPRAEVPLDRTLRDFGQPEPDPASGSPPAVVLALTLALGLAIGGAGGYLLGQRSGERAAQRALGAEAGLLPDQGGFTESTVEEEPIAPAGGEAPRADSGAAAPAPPPAQPSGRAAPPPTRERPASGQIVVQSSPARAGVIVNNVWQGRTPLTVSGLSLGTHTVRVVEDGYQPETRRVALDARVPSTRLSVQLQPVARAARPAAPRPAASTGTLFLESRPAGARVMVDGTFVGVTPLLMSDLRPGSRQVRFEHPGHRTWATTVMVVAGERVRVAASLEEGS